MSPLNLTDNHQNYSIYSDQSGGYSVINRPEHDNNVIYRIPEDYIDSNNYMKHNNILHTELYSDRGRHTRYRTRTVTFIKMQQFNFYYYRDQYQSLTLWHKLSSWND